MKNVLRRASALLLAVLLIVPAYAEDTSAEGRKQDLEFLYEEVLKKQRELPELPYQPMKKRTGLDALLDSGASICPECGQKLRHEGGCVICDCGFSHCG